MQHGEVRRGTINGLSIEPLSPELAEQLGAPSPRGALVVRVYQGTDAFDAGLRRGDIIVGFNGRGIDDPAQLFRLVADATIGSTATLRIIRVGREMDLKVPIISSARGNR
jgi:serine protease Do